mgnify:CR=1 FL=1|jgi:hypothetical protein
MHTACVKIEQQTGDPIANHESMGGDWSVSAIITALELQGYHVHRAVKSRQCRTWCGDSLETLLENKLFRGLILHQPANRHFTCIRPEQIDGKTYLYYVDSQLSGPIRIAAKLAEQRCLSSTYSWEPYIVMGDSMEYVAPPHTESPRSTEKPQERPRVRPSEEFMKDWHDLANQPN